jgi:hypothetical protein
MADWEFEIVPANLVQQNPTQRDQFDNDEVGLSESLVREVIQNSTDAVAGEGPVTVTFAVHELDQTQSHQFSAIFEKLRPHLKECGIKDAILDGHKARILVVEDFGTKGLTGSVEEIDGQNFNNFWRVHGGSGKGGTSGGRWGLGKLVYSSSSLIRAFFGITFREGDEGPVIMGQAVLKFHLLNGKRHPPHGFWFGRRGIENVQLPVGDTVAIDVFRQIAKFTRLDQPGLSVVIPYLRENIDEKTIIRAVLKNYYFPILAGRLNVTVGNTLIDQKTFHAVAAAQEEHEAPIALDFVEAVSARLNSAPDLTLTTQLNRGLGEKSFTPEELERIKALYRDQKLIHVRVPLSLNPTEGDAIRSHVDLFLQNLPEGRKPFALYARGSITVPGEARFFGNVSAYGAMVASEKGISEFLGDAENPAHTNWVASAEKLSERWKTPGPIVKNIRYALKELWTLVAEQLEHEDRDALLDLFSLLDPIQQSMGKKKRKKKVEIPPPREKGLIITAIKGGFQIQPGPSAASWEFPRRLRIRVAYDTMVGNPFNAHSPYDFDITTGEIKIDSAGAKIETTEAMALNITVEGPEFSISGSGFDLNRDIVVDARAVK